MIMVDRHSYTFLGLSPFNGNDMLQLIDVGSRVGNLGSQPGKLISKGLRSIVLMANGYW